MSEHMSAKQYRQEMGIDMPDFVQEPIKKKKAANFKTRTGVAVFQGNKKVDEINGDWQSVKPRNHEEDDITKQVAEYLEVLQLQKKVVLFSHIPQETFTKSWVTKNKNKAMGVRAGVPDMIIVFPKSVLFLELKRLKGGKVSDAQKAWIEALNNVEKPALNSTHRYVEAKVACGFVEAKDIIDSLID